MNRRFLRTAFFAFFVLLSFSFLQAQQSEGKNRLRAYQELYQENTVDTDEPDSFLQMDEGQSMQPSSEVTVPGFGGASKPFLRITARVHAFPQGGNPGQLEIAARIPKGFKIYSLTQKPGGPYATIIHFSDVIKLAGEIVSSPPPHVEMDTEIWGDLKIESHQDFVKWIVPFVWTDPQNHPEQITGSVESQMCNVDSCLPPRKFPFTAPVFEIAEDSSRESNVESVDTQVKPFPEIEVGPSGETPGVYSDETMNAGQNPPLTEMQTGIPDSISLEPSQDEILNTIPGMTPETSDENVQLKEAVQDFSMDEFEEKVDYSLAIILVMAYLGGLILNLMPCVLPVIAPKLHSFVRQAGEARGRIFFLNVSYTLGLLTVLWLLAVLSRIGDLLMILRKYVPATAPYLPEIGNMGWGQQFTYPGFVIFMISLVFVMGLSFLGVWEIPIPGMVTSGNLGKMQRKEGFLGAYCMGILTTLLATPCVGPYLGPVFGWVMTQPIWTAFLTFTVIGLGLGTPYLVIGAFPALISFLPKPGEWMETLKEVMGFFFLGTVVWLFFCLPSRFFVPTLGLLVAVWFACWLIGKTTLSGASREAQLTAWCAGIIVSALIGFVLFSMDFQTEIPFSDGEYESQTQIVDENKIPWRKYSQTAVENALNQNQIVFIDFTARWCMTCQTNGKVAIDTPEVAHFIREKNILPLLVDSSDWSKHNEVDLILHSFNRNSIPLTVILIPGEEKPVLLDGLLSKRKVLRALEFAAQRASGKD